MPAMSKPLTTSKRRRKPTARVPVLVVLSADAFVEVYGVGLQVHFAQRLAVEVPEEAMADAYLDATLPRRFRDLFFPRNLRAMGQCRQRTATDEAERRFRLELVRALAELARGPAKTPAAIQRARRAAG